MVRRRILYLAVVTGCLIFYMVYREWLAWLLLLGVLWLPVLSAAVSLPAMLTVQLQLDTPGTIPLGQRCSMTVQLRCKLPCPLVRCRFSLQELSTGQKLVLRSDKAWTPEHCGAWTVRLHRSFVYDYLGLLRLPVGRRLATTVYIEPTPAPMEVSGPLSSLSPRQWKPKPGGGFAENHDLRLYRPGDSLHHIHWKMAAKTGKLIYREPMEPAGEVPVLLLHLSGSRQELDEKLGKFLWLSRYLLSRQTVHELRCLTGSGLYRCQIPDGAALTGALHELLRRPAALGNAVMPEEHRQRCFRIGGAPNET